MLPFRPLFRYATFSGRASRGEYLSFLLLQGVAHTICIGLGVLSLSRGARGIVGLVGWLGVSLLLLLVCALPNYAVLARRLHDVGRSAKWMALILAPFLSQGLAFGAAGHGAMEVLQSGGGEAAAISALAGQAAGAGVMTLVAMGCSLALFVMTMMQGTRGPNRYGPDPRDPHASGPASSGSRLAGIDEARLDDLFAQAKRDARHAVDPGQSVTDVGPGLSSAPAPTLAATRVAVDWGQPAYDPGLAPSRPFGRRA